MDDNEQTIHNLEDAVTFLEKFNSRAIGKAEASIRAAAANMMAHPNISASGTLGYWLERNPEAPSEFTVWVNPSLALSPR